MLGSGLILIPQHYALRSLPGECCREVGNFVWYPVGREVGNVRNQGAELIDPLVGE